MKRIIACLLLLPSLAFADARDIIMMQRNADDTGQLTRLVTHPPGTDNGILGYSGDTQLPFFFGIGAGLSSVSGSIGLANAGTPGTYSTVSTDAQGRVTAGTGRSQTSATRALNAAFQINPSRDAIVSYSVQLTVTASITGGQNGDVILEVASDSGFTANVQTVAIAGLGQVYSLAIAIQGVQPQTGVVAGMVPAGYYARLRTVNNTGTPTFAYRAGQEVLL